MSYDALLTDTCTVRIATQSTDTTTGYGAAVTFADTSNVRCLIQKTSTSEAIEFGKLTGRNVYRGFFAYGAGPQAPKDRITWNGLTLECIGRPIDPTGQRHHEETTLADPVDE